MTFEPSLDDRLYRLQADVSLPRDLRIIVSEADVAYLKGEEEKSKLLLDKAEAECTRRNINLLSWDSLKEPLALELYCMNS